MTKSTYDEAKWPVPKSASYYAAKLIEENALRSGKRGRPREYPNELFAICVLIRMQFNIKYRPLEGMLVGMIGREATPHYATIQRRSAGIILEKIDTNTYTFRLSEKEPTGNIISIEKASNGDVLTEDGSGMAATHGGDWRRFKHGGKKAYIRPVFIADANDL